MPSSTLNQQLKDLLPHQNPQTIQREWKYGDAVFTIADLIEALPVASEDTENSPLQTQVHAEVAQCKEIFEIYEILKGIPALGNFTEEIIDLPADIEELQELMEA